MCAMSICCEYMLNVRLRANCINCFACFACCVNGVYYVYVRACVLNGVSFVFACVALYNVQQVAF